MGIDVFVFSPPTCCIVIHELLQVLDIMIIMIMTMMVTLMMVVMIIMMTNGHLIQELKDQVELLISVDNIEELGGHNPIVIFIVIIFNHNLMLIASSLLLKRPEQSQGAPTLSKGRSP